MRSEITPGPNEIGLTDLTAFALAPFHIAVHFDENQEPEVAVFEQKYDVVVERLSNSQAILITEQTNLQRIGK